MINKVEIANVNTSKLQVLTNKQNKELFEQMRNGDIEAREKIINGNCNKIGNNKLLIKWVYCKIWKIKQKKIYVK